VRQPSLSVMMTIVLISSPRVGGSHRRWRDCVQDSICRKRKSMLVDDVSGNPLCADTELLRDQAMMVSKKGGAGRLFAAGLSHCSYVYY
jgi:hypothetical protein